MSENNRYGVFSQCNAKFRGQKDPAAVDEFLSAICIFKEINAISNTDALIEMPLLLEDYAAAWWIGVQDTICTFEQAVALIRSTFSPPVPDWQIFTDMFENKQQKNEPTEMFVRKKVFLLSQLQMPPGDIIQLNMVYALLHRSIKERVQRENINSFQDLIAAGREAELLILEAASTTAAGEKKTRSRCGFCRLRGHLMEDCFRKKQRDEGQPESQCAPGNNEVQPTEQQLIVNPNLCCYGCGAPGVYRSNCSPCNGNWVATTKKQILDFNSSTVMGHSLPTTKVRFFGITNEVVFDTGAKTSVAGLKVQKLFKSNNSVFEDIGANITLADGSIIISSILSTTCNIFIGNRRRKIKLIQLPNAKNERTLLGMDFLEQEGIVLNMAQRYWYFEDEPHEKYNFANSMEAKTNLTGNDDVQFIENDKVTSNLLSPPSSSSASSFSPPAKIRKVQRDQGEDVFTSLFLLDIIN